MRDGDFLVPGQYQLVQHDTDAIDALPVYAMDFESYYDDEVSIKPLGAYNYLRHPKQDIYLVAVYGPGVDYVGRPEGFDWEILRGNTVIAHNYAFDGQVTQRLKELGIVPEDLEFGYFNCSANLTAYMGVPRSLASACQFLLNKKVSKEMRGYMKGKYWDDAERDGKAEALIAYGRQDSSNCYDLWMKWRSRWPEVERELSRLTIEITFRGMDVDRPRVELYITRLEKLLKKAEEAIPWITEGKKPTSAVAANAAALAAGIQPPSSWARDNEECIEWFEEHSKTLKWAKAMRLRRRVNMQLTKFQTLLRQTNPQGRFLVPLKYAGAHTLRWSGGSGEEEPGKEGSGFNPQNLPAKVMFGTNLRRCLRAKPGHKLIVCDLSQIEARLLLYFAKDFDQLNEIAEGKSVYEVHARRTMGWTGGKLKDEDPLLYKLAKARRLALGYQAGWEKFIFMATVQYDCAFVFEKEVADQAYLEFFEYIQSWGSAEQKKKIEHARNVLSVENPFKASKYLRTCVNSWLIVSDFRAKEPRVKRLWDDVDSSFKSSHGEDFRLVLPNGRPLVYLDVQVATRSATAVICKNEKFKREKFYGGKLVENLVQATARDVFAESKLLLRQYGHHIVLTAHDEVVLESPRSASVKEVEEIMSISPKWLKGCPISAEGFETEYYKKG